MTVLSLSSLTALLLPFLGHAVIGVVVLWTRTANRHANRWLAGLLLVLALRTLPYVLGYSGAYDRHPWLTFAPFDWTLAIGPLLYGYVLSLTTGAGPRRAWRHFVPVAAQGAYTLVAFAEPLERKWAWYVGPHLTIVEPVGVFAVIVSVSCYLLASRRALAHYDSWLRSRLGDIEPVRLGWLRVMVGGLSVLLVLLTGFALAHVMLRPIDYFERFPLMIAVGLFADVLAVLGWRYGDAAMPVSATFRNESRPDSASTSPGEQSERPHEQAAALTTWSCDYRTDNVAINSAAILEGRSDAGSRAPDASPRTGDRYHELARAWALRFEAERWYGDHDLTLRALAMRVGVSERTASRVLHEGFGLTFHRFVNEARVREVTTRLRDPLESGDVLALALDAGFSSKSSFNRVFREITGMSPTRWRSEQRRRLVGAADDPSAHEVVPQTA